ncbi:putative glutamine ABC transporter permease protein GlnM [Castellaniella defragrans]
MSAGFDAGVVISNIPLFVKGLENTLLISVTAIPLAILCGLAVALMRLSDSRYLQRVAIVYVEFFRNVPFLIQLFLMYYILPFYGVRLPAMLVGISVLSLYAGSYFSEIIRSAILSIPKGQVEAARAFGMSKFQYLKTIIFPQLPPYITPPLMNQSSTLVKDTSLLSTITIQELTMAAQTVQLTTYNFVEPLLLIAIIYYLINLLLVLGMKFISRRYADMPTV